MASPKDTYTFSSSREDCDYKRILNENRNSKVIVLTGKNSESPTITLVRSNAYTELQRLADKGETGVAYVCTGHGFGDGVHLAEIFIGDVHVAALGIVETKVEAY
jgi:hypothetical protein